MESDSNNHKMKTAEEWYKVLTTTEVIDKQTGGDLLITHINKEQVRQIQLDAWKQGVQDLYTELTTNNTPLELAWKMLVNKHE